MQVTPTTPDRAVRLVARVAGDARFQPLVDGSLRDAWRAYRGFG